jgi:hypothetical protein
MMRNYINEPTKYLKIKDFRFWLLINEPTDRPFSPHLTSSPPLFGGDGSARLSLWLRATIVTTQRGTLSPDSASGSNEKRKNKPIRASNE